MFSLKILKAKFEFNLIFASLINGGKHDFLIVFSGSD